MNFPSRPRVLAFLLALPLAACSGADPARLAPDFALKDGSGKSVALSAQRGHVVLLNFWATWCDSCREELPALKDLQSRSGGRYVLLAVSVDEDPAKVPPFLKKYGLDYPVAYAEPGGATLRAYAVRDLPTTFLIGPDGQIERRYVGPLDERAVENDILALLRRPS
jgi:peroxiredoxin